MINFTNCKEELNNYKGSEKKKTLIYDGKKYLVKFPDPIREKNKNISYINNAFSEYIGSNIFKMVGFSTQNTIIGVYKYNEKEKIVCACEDFTDSNKVLYEFENLALSTNPDKKIETELTDILNVLDENKIISIPKIKEKFWDMFAIDSLIGNTDRHNGNWGFLLDTKTNKIEFAPIYDCGSCLNPMIDDDEIKKYIGEVSYYFEEEYREYVLNIIIEYPYRHLGKGKVALELLCKQAKESGLRFLCDDIETNNPAKKLFLDLGFKEVWARENITMLKKRL